MIEDYIESEKNLLGSILTSDENESLPCERISSNTISNKNPSYQICQFNHDSFSKSFEQITLNLDCHGSPTSPDDRFRFRTPLNYTTCSSFSSDNNQTSLDNSTHYAHNPCFEYFQKPQEQFSPLFYSQAPFWPHYSKQYTSQDPQLAIDIENMCGNQALSRKVQKIFETGTMNQKQQIFAQIETNCIKFSKDIFGNYVVQKILEKGTKQQQQSLFTQLQPHIADISKNNYGCRVIQKLVEVFGNSEHQMKLILQEIVCNIKSLLLDQIGKYVILKCLEIFPKQKMEFLLQHVETQCSHMCQSQYGCKIIQKIIEFFPKESESLIQKCIMNQQYLYDSQHGNYIIQNAMLNPENIEKFVEYIFQNLERLCFNKYASNTVEAILQFLNYSQQQQMVEILVKKKGANNIVSFVNISTNPFGNYVIKRLLLVFDPEILKAIYLEIKNDPNLLIQIKSSEFGQRIYALLNTQLNDYN